MASSKVTVVRSGEGLLQGGAIPGFLLEMMQAGGLVAFLKQQLTGNTIRKEKVSSWQNTRIIS
jgi:hypothetical protein